MSNLPVYAGWLAGALALAEIYPYTLSIIGRDMLLRKLPKRSWTVPSLATWTILSAEGFMAALSYYERNDMNDFWFFAGLFLEYFIAAILSIWYGEHRWKRKKGQKTKIFGVADIVCLAGAAIGFLVWLALGSWEIPIAIIILIDGFGLYLTVEKVWRLPRSEDFRAWTMTVTGCALSIVALGAFSSWDFDRAALPIYMLLANGLIWSLLFRRFAKKG